MPKGKRPTSQTKKNRKTVSAKKRKLSSSKKKVAFVPKGYHSVTPYLVMENAKAAIDYYKKVFVAKVAMCMEKPGGMIGHAELKIGDAKIMLADEYPDMGAYGPKHYNGSPVSINLYIKDVDTVVQRAVAGGAKLLRPVENMFYGDRSGTIEDPFGHRWHVSTHVEDVSLAQLKKRAAAMGDKK